MQVIQKTATMGLFKVKGICEPAFIYPDKLAIDNGLSLSAGLGPGLQVW